ncbi:MAG: arginine--tRNA ligase [Betaproteobacteria bacterium]|nr:arginine--tRNA ligase [Betaproteobacteria bacterium]
MNTPSLPLLTQLNSLFHQAMQTVAPSERIVSTLERPKQSSHGDYAHNGALQLAKSLKLPPREVANKIIAALPENHLIERCDIAGPGFINVFVKSSAKQQVIQEVLKHKDAWGNTTLGHDRKLLIEFVSSNPTGPLHVGHGRGASFGDSLANILQKAGFKVSKEYYVNDAGRQMDILTLSTWLRYLALFGSKIALPSNGYQGEYVMDMAKLIKDKWKDTLYHADEFVLLHLDVPEEDGPEEAVEKYMDALIARAKFLLKEHYESLHQQVLALQLKDCQEDLQAFGVSFDEWFSEASLFHSGAVKKVVEELDQKGYLYRQDGALWFKSTAFGDEKDRVVQRENGIYTYFASDIAYHANKFERGFDVIVDVWGADHHGYIPRVKAALSALGYNTERLTVPLVQFVSLFRGGEKVQMSTRKAQFVTLRELREEVGNDAARLFYILRKSDQHLDFDLDLAKSRSNDNPVYYIQYAHARIHSVLSKWAGDTDSLIKSDLSLLNLDHEFNLMQLLEDYPDIINAAAKDYAPHTLAFYLKALASELHSYYNSQQFLVEDESLCRARLALILAISMVLKDGLKLLGVSAPLTM